MLDWILVMMENQNVSTKQKQMLFNALSSIDNINKELFSKLIKLIWDMLQKIHFNIRWFLLKRRVLNIFYLEMAHIYRLPIPRFATVVLHFVPIVFWFVTQLSVKYSWSSLFTSFYGNLPSFSLNIYNIRLS